jgi:catechol 2,3-dioxygenase-like lactoylglutathione lyase family enzyme
MLKVVEMDHIVLNVSDAERSLDFYTRLLGLGAERVDEFRKGEVRFPSVRVNEDTIIDLFVDTGEGERVRPNLNHYCLIVEPTDLDELADHLEGEGVRIVQRPASRWGAHGRGMSFYLLDPDDNQIELRCYANEQ